MTSKLESAALSSAVSGSECVLDLSVISNDPEVATPVKPTERLKRRGPRKSRKRLREEECEDEDSEARRLLANTQERVRMHKMNQALEELKNVLPPHFHAFRKRMSKIRTLRLAMSYMTQLSNLIQQDNARQEAAYRQTLQYIQERGCIPQFSTDGVLVSSIYPYGPDHVPMTPVFHTPQMTTPYHAYIGSLHGLENSNAFETPLQNPLRRQPRHLDFSLTPGRHQSTISETVIAGTVETPLKSEKNNFVAINTESESVHSEIRKLRKFEKPETFTSPFLGSRNTNELDLSFLSTGSDSNREETECGARGTTLEDIIDGASDNDDVQIIAV